MAYDFYAEDKGKGRDVHAHNTCLPISQFIIAFDLSFDEIKLFKISVFNIIYFHLIQKQEVVTILTALAKSIEHPKNFARAKEP